MWCWWGGGIHGAEGGAKLKRKPESKEDCPEPERKGEGPQGAAATGGQFCSRTQVAVGWAGQGSRRTPHRQRRLTGEEPLTSGGPSRRGCRRSGSDCRHRRLSSSGRSRVPLAACASLTAAAAAAPGPGCGAARGAA